MSARIACLMTNRKLLRACVRRVSNSPISTSGQRGQDHVVSMSRSNLEYGAIIDADDENDGDLVLPHLISMPNL